MVCLKGWARLPSGYRRRAAKESDVMGGTLLMEHKLEGDSLTAYLSGKVDSQNAPRLERELFALIEANPGKRVTLDAQKLIYISSAGLRMLLRAHKLAGGLRVENVSPDVYDILRTTGFTEILDVRRALREISVEGCEEIGAGGFGTVYRLDPDTIVKVYRSPNFADIERSLEDAKRAFVRGVPTAISYDVVRCGGHYGVVFEMIRSDTLARAMLADYAHFDEYVEKYVALLKTVNGVRFEPGELPVTAELYRDELAPLYPYFTDEERAALERYLDTAAARSTLVHGDFHARNVMVQDGELLLIDMDELTCGHPILDLAGVWLAYTVHTNDEKAFRYQGLHLADCARLLNRFLDCCFSGFSEEERIRVRSGMAAAAQVRFAQVRILSRKARGEESDPVPLAEELREKFVPYVDDVLWLMDRIDW